MRKTAVFLVLFFTALGVRAQSALSYQHLVIFGDNYSDDVNTYDATMTWVSGIDQNGDPTTTFEAYPPSGYFTNGPDTSAGFLSQFKGIWHQQLHTLLPGVPLATPNFQQYAQTSGSTNYAWGGATTGAGDTVVNYPGAFTVTAHNMSQQIDDYLNAGNTPDSMSLYVLFGGLNDLLADSSAANITATAANVTADAKLLIGAGAVHVLIVNVPGISANVNSPIDVAASSYSAQLASNLAALKAQYILAGKAVNLTTVDLNALYTNIMQSPASFGFTDVTDKADAANALGNYTADVDGYLNWDGTNPTTAGHHQIANAVCTALTQTKTTLTVNNATPTLAQPATLTATVSTSGTYGPQSTITPTGTVTFYYPQTVLGTTTMIVLGTAAIGSNGQASVTTAGLAANPYTISAVYNGDANFPSGCISNAQTVTVVTAVQSFNFNASPAAEYLAMEEGFMLTLTPASIGGFTGNVTFTCGALPRFFSCSFINPTVPVVGGSVTYSSSLTVLTTDTQNARMEKVQPIVPRQFSTRARVTLAALFAAPLMLIIGRRKAGSVRLAGLFAFALALSIVMTSLTACSGGGTKGASPSTPVGPSGPGITYAAPGTYSFEIIGTSGSLTVSQTYSVYIADTY